MTRKQSQAGFYTLRSMKIRPLLPSQRKGEGSADHVDITKVVTDWSLQESIDSPFISGSAIIQESDDLLSKVPLIGEEEIEITYQDFYGDIQTHIMFIYSIEDIKPLSSINDRMVKYTVRFCTKQKLLTDTKEISRSFSKQKISDIASILYEEYFKPHTDKEIEIEETDGEQVVVVPCLYPDAAMQFLSRRAYSSNNKTSLYRFFETREKYYFCTSEYLTNKYSGFEGISEEERNRLFFIYNTVDDNTGTGQTIAQQSVNTVNYGTKVDTMNDMKLGGYRRTVNELDINYRSRIKRTYDYSDEYKDYKAPEDLKLTHSQEFLDSFMADENSPTTTLVTDFPQIGMGKGKNNMLKPYQHFYENYTTKPIVDYHMNRNAFDIEINGREKLYAGMIINLELIKFSNTLAGTREIDTERSGKYLIMNVGSNFSGDEFKQTLRITKGGLS